MPHTELAPAYEIKLSQRELRLVTLALAGELKDNTDIGEARQLNVHLCHQRELQLKQALEVATKAKAGAIRIADATSKEEGEQ